MREAVFARLTDLGDVETRRVLDLYAGTGALGIEALSRGAASVVFVDRAAGVLAVLRANLEALGVGDAARTVRADATTAVRRLAREGERFDLVLADPPYGSPELGPLLRALASSGILAPGAAVVVETDKRDILPETPGLALRDERRYGDTLVRWLASETDRPTGSGSDAEGGNDA